MRCLPVRGMLLLPVALTLAVTGALAWSMVRDGAMRSSATDAEYDADVARYLAEAALNLARWQNEKLGCGSAVAFGSFSLPGGTLKTNDVHAVLGGLSIDVSSATDRGGSNRIARSPVALHSSYARTEVTIGGLSGSDTYIRNGGGTPSDNSYLEISDGSERGLVQFSLAAVPSDALVVSSELRLYQFNTKSSQSAQILYVHRLTRGWQASSATWLSPWSTAGGDYLAEPVGSIAIAGNQQYSLRVDALVDGWLRQWLPNYGVLLDSSGLSQARFASLESSSNPPQLVVRYYPRCL
jgi:Tfp pilus assembly protein PilX